MKIIYNFIEIKKILLSKGVKFRTNSDTEVVLEAYKFWGVNCLEFFEGMFAVAIWDKRNEKLFLARDRIGEKPLFYYPYDGKNFKNLSYADGLGNGGIESIEVDGKNIWLGGTQPAGTLTLYNGTAMKNFNIPQMSRFGMKINDIKKASNGKIWFADQNRGLFSYDGQDFKNYLRPWH